MERSREVTTFARRKQSRTELWRLSPEQEQNVHFCRETPQAEQRTYRYCLASDGQDTLPSKAVILYIRHERKNQSYEFLQPSYSPTNSIAHFPKKLEISVSHWRAIRPSSKELGFEAVAWKLQSSSRPPLGLSFPICLLREASGISHIMLHNRTMLTLTVWSSSECLLHARHNHDNPGMPYLSEILSLENLLCHFNFMSK